MSPPRRANVGPVAKQAGHMQVIYAVGRMSQYAEHGGAICHQLNLHQSTKRGKPLRLFTHAPHDNQHNELADQCGICTHNLQIRSLTYYPLR